ncbi:hypothetical protein CDAR_367321, partial [Caerostris darwini]
MDLGQHHDWWTSPCRWQWPFRNKQVTNRHGERESSAEDVVPPPEHGPERRDVHSGPSSASKKYVGHRVLLAMTSPVFEAMFYGDMADKSKVIRITDLAPIGFENLL